jgi:hypothetical protein
MSLVRRAFLKKSVLSVILTAVVITLLVFAGPRAAQALTITVSNPATGILGSPVTFTVEVNIEDTDLLPIDHIDLHINSTNPPGSDAYFPNLPLPSDDVTPVDKDYSDPGSGNLHVVGNGDSNWGGADSGAAERYGYGYVEGSGEITQTYAPGYGYGYINGGNIGPTSVTYDCTWTSPGNWPVGAYEIKVLVYGNGGGSAITHPDTYTFTLSAGGGGGGGGGGGMVGVLAFGYIIDSQGKLSVEARAISENAEAYLVLAAGTYCLLDGAPITFIYIWPLAEDKVPPVTPNDGQFVTRIFTLGPEGANFSPSITLIFNYNPSLIPDGFDEADLYIAKWDDQSNQWIKLGSLVNPDKGTISCLVSSFSDYAVIAAHYSEPEPEITPEPEPEPEPEPIPTPPTTTEPGPEPEPETPPVITTEPEPNPEPETVTPIIVPIDITHPKGINQWVVAGSVFGGAVLIVALAIYLFWYRKILE